LCKLICFFFSSHLYKFYPSRKPESEGGLGRSASTQAWFQLAALVMTIGFAVVSGILTGIIMRLPIFEQIRSEEDMFTDRDNWHTPDDFLEVKSEEANVVDEKNWQLEQPGVENTTYSAASRL
jgi:hypothetical protein